MDADNNDQNRAPSLLEVPEPRAVSADEERNAFIQAMRGAVAGVTVVTTDGPLGRFGLTVSAFCSVSADPPMVLVCVNHETPLRVAVMGNQRFCVNVLSSQQRGLAETFAGLSRDGKPYDFAPGLWDEAVTGVPVLVDAVASFDCTLERAVPAGSHAIFIGRAIQVRRKAVAPLTYSNRTYGRPVPLGA